MEQKIRSLIAPAMQKIGLMVDDVRMEKTGRIKNLVIVLDREEPIDLKKIVAASKIINPIIDKADLIKEEYVLDIQAKSKGGDYNE